MQRIHLYFRQPPPVNRVFPGDRFIIPLLRKMIKGKKVSGVEKVFLNLCKGFDELQVIYDVNLSFKKIKPGEPVVVLGDGKYSLEGYQQSNPIIAGIALMTHPAQWPDLFEEYPVALYLQHCQWAANIYIPYFGAAHCALWPAGIDTQKWQPNPAVDKSYDFLIYDKVRWNKDLYRQTLTEPIIKRLTDKDFTYATITYGDYQEGEYLKLLQQSRAMIFLCEHESQGFACCEAMAMDVPVFAWDQGSWLDPNRFTWGEPEHVPASSVPFFDERCGARFRDYAGFELMLNDFWESVSDGRFSPRAYIMKSLTLKMSAMHMLQIIKSVYS